MKRLTDGCRIAINFFIHLLSRMSQFPIVLIPPSIERVRSALPPREPFAETPPEKPGFAPQKLNTSVLAIETVVAVPVVSIISQGQSGLWWFLFLVAIGAIVTHAWHQLNTYPQRKLEHNRKVAAYPGNLESYNRRKQEYEQIAKEALSPERVAEFRYKLLLQVLSQTVPHDGAGSLATVGNAEAQFGRYLNCYFPNKIHKRLTLQIPDFEYPYTPDFAYIDRELNLYIDIELDEPYVYQTGEPTHYLGAWKDNNRDRFFINRGWVVIRFSEEQVICYPDSCCKTIAQVIAQITGNEFILKEFSSVLDLQPVRQWTEVEAAEMAASRKRDNYQYPNPSSHSKPAVLDSTRPVSEEVVVRTSQKDAPQKTRKTSRSLRRNFHRFLTSQPDMTDLSEAKKIYLDNLASQSTGRGKWVRNNRAKAESFLKDWKIND